MSKKQSFPDYLNELLPTIDEMMISKGEPLKDRPLLAISYLFIEAEIDGKKFKPSLSSDDPESHRIYFYILNAINSWYRKKYAEAFSPSSSNNVCGLVVCLATPFLIDVPIIITKPGKKNKTVWLHFPLTIHDSEDPISWLRFPPNISCLSPKELSELKNSCTDISISIRNINNKIIGIPKGSTTFNGLLANAVNHIEGAATKSLSARHSDINAAAIYEIHMACETFFKALLLQKTGRSCRIHDLKELYDLADEYLIDFDYSRIEQIPSWYEINNKYRYGESGGYIDLSDYNNAYQAMLYIVDSIAKPMVSIWLKGASVEIAVNPFAKDNS